MTIESKSFVKNIESSDFSGMVPADMVYELKTLSLFSNNPDASLKLALAYYILAIKNPQGKILEELITAPKIFAEEIKKSGNEDSTPRYIFINSHKQVKEPTYSISLDLSILRRIRQNANLKEFWGQLKKYCNDVSPDSLRALTTVIDYIG